MASPIPSLAAPSPRQILSSSRLPTSIASPSGQSVASTSRDQPDKVAQAIARLRDPESPLSLDQFVKQYEEFRAGVDNAFHLAGDEMQAPRFDYNARLKQLRESLAAIETHLRTTGLGALPLLQPGQEIDVQQLMTDRDREGRAAFDTKRAGKESADVVLGILQKARRERMTDGGTAHQSS